MKQWVQRNHPSTWFHIMEGLCDTTALNNFTRQMLTTGSSHQCTGVDHCCVNNCKCRIYTVGPKEPTFNMASPHGRFVRLHGTEQLRLQMLIAGSFQQCSCVDHCALGLAKGRDKTVGPKEPSFNMELHHGRLMRHHSIEQLHTANVNCRTFPSVHWCRPLCCQRQE